MSIAGERSCPCFSVTVVAVSADKAGNKRGTSWFGPARAMRDLSQSVLNGIRQSVIGALVMFLNPRVCTCLVPIRLAMQVLLSLSTSRILKGPLLGQR